MYVEILTYNIEAKILEFDIIWVSFSCNQKCVFVFEGKKRLERRLSALQTWPCLRNVQQHITFPCPSSLNVDGSCHTWELWSGRNDHESICCYPTNQSVTGLKRTETNDLCVKTLLSPDCVVDVGFIWILWSGELCLLGYRLLVLVCL